MDLLSALGVLAMASAGVLVVVLRLDSTEHHRRLRRETRQRRRCVRDAAR